MAIDKNMGKAGYTLANMMANPSAHIDEITAEILDGVGQARIEQVKAAVQTAGYTGIGDYGFSMKHLVAFDFVNQGPGWKNPETATWTGKMGVKSYDDFLKNPEAQYEAYKTLLIETLEAVTFEIDISPKEEVIGAKKIIQAAPYVPTFALRELARTQNTEAPGFVDAAVANGCETGAELLDKVVRRPENEMEDFGL